MQRPHPQKNLPKILGILIAVYLVLFGAYLVGAPESLGTLTQMFPAENSNVGIGLLASSTAPTALRPPSPEVAEPKADEVAIAEALPAPERSVSADVLPSDPRPTRLYIPSLRIDARVQSVGIASTGNISAPTNFSDVGWYKYGSFPGEKGTVIIDGHVDNGLFRSGVFKHLDKIAQGDRISVSTSKGDTVTYVVSRLEYYGYKDVPMEPIVRQTEIAQMVLITCAGDWIPKEKTYTERLVVYAELL